MRFISPSRFQGVLLIFLLSACFAVYAQPVITTISPGSGTAGSSITISGSNFNPTAAGNIVYIGNMKATVTAASPSSLTVTVPGGASYGPVSVLNTSTRLSGFSSQYFLPKQSPSKSTLIKADLTFDGLTTPISRIYGGVVGDLNGDNKPDLVINDSGWTSTVENTLLIQYNTSTTAGPLLFDDSDSQIVTFAGYNGQAIPSLGDMDGDGLLDIIAAANVTDVGPPQTVTQSDVFVLRNNGNGTFSQSGPFTTSLGTEVIRTADIDGDGLTDVATLNYISGSVSILRNTSSGVASISFAPPADLTGIGQGLDMVLTDINMDGKPDIVTLKSNSNGFAVFLNTSTPGNISFASAGTIATNAGPNRIVAGDIDGDGYNDLVVTSGDNSVTTAQVFHNRYDLAGTLDFNTVIAIPIGDSQQACVLGDINGDGKPDLAISSDQNFGSLDYRFFLFRNTSTPGAISFSEGDRVTQGGINGYSRFLAIADLNADGKQDVLAGATNTGRIGLYRNTLQFPPIITSFSPATAAPGTAITINGENFNTTAGSNLVYFGATAAVPTAATATSLTVTVPAGASYAPLTVLNIANALSGKSSTNFTPVFTPGKSDLMATDFTQQTTITRPGFSLYGMVTTDLDGDKKPEIIETDRTDNKLYIHRNTGSVGSIGFTAPVAIDLSLYSGPAYPAAGDLDGDGKQDLAVPVFGSNKLVIMRNTGDLNTIDVTADYATGSQPIAAAIADLDGDGKPDVVTANYGDGSISVFRNLSVAAGIISLDAVLTYAPGPDAVYAVHIADIDGDGKPDIVTQNTTTNLSQSYIAVYKNTSIPGVISFAARQDFTTLNAPWGMAVGDIDGDGKADIVVANSSSNTSFSVFLNTSSVGSVGFAAKQDFNTVKGQNWVSLGDLNGDGKPDIVLSLLDPLSGTDYKVAVFPNTSTSGNVSFGTRIDLDAGDYPHVNIVQDLDGDGKPDILSGNYNDHSISVHRNTLIAVPVTQASDIIVGDFSSATATINWTNGSGGKRVVFVKADNAGSASPVDGTDYTANSAFGSGDQIGSSGWYAVYNGTGNTAAVTGLSPSVTYRVMVVEYNDNGLADVAQYQTAAATGNPVNFTTLSPPPSISSFSPLAAKPGDDVTITGINFNTAASDNIVYFGGVEATVTSAAATSLTVTVPVGATYAPITVLNTGNGLSALSPQSFHPVFAPHKGFIAPYDIAVKNDSPTGDQPVTVAYGDLDGDGKPDMAVANSTGHSISVFLNTGSTGNVSFTRQDISLGGSATVFGLVIGDIDGDGKPDLAATVTNGNYVSVHRNISTGAGNIGFEAEAQFPVQSSPINLAFGDIDGDGRPDLAVANTGSNSFSILRNTGSPGTISFAAHASYATGSTLPDGIMISDINLDGRADVIIANKGSNSISIFPNNSDPGSLAFDTQYDAIAGAVPTGIAIGDMDGDGMPDIAVTNQTGDNISVFRNTGSAGGGVSLDAALTFAAGDQPMGISIGDINGDGKADLVVANYRSDDISVLRNASSGTTIDFIKDINLLTAGLETRAVVLTDVDGDGKPDITVLTQASDMASVFLNNLQVPPVITSFAPSTVAPGTSVTIAGENFNTTAANNTVYFGGVRGTVNTASATSLDVTVPAGAAYAPVSVLNTAAGLSAYSKAFFLPGFLPNKGDIITADFKPKIDLPSGAKPEAVAIIDFDGDGKPDMASVNYDGDMVSVFYNTGSAGSMSFAGQVDYATGTNPTSVAVGDIDGDGKPDMAITNFNSDKVTIYRNTSTPGNISFAGRLDLTVGGCPFFLIIRDLDEDGKADIATANKLSNSVSVLKNTSVAGTILFEPKLDYMVGAEPYSLAVGDIDGDNKPDLITANYTDGTLSLLHNVSDPGAIDFAAATDVSVPGVYSVSVGDLDGDGKLDLVTANLLNQQASVLRNISTAGNFSFDPAVTLATGDRPYSIAIGDLNGDGKPDIATPNYNSNTISVFPNTGSTGTISFATHVEFITGAGPAYVAIGDIDGDGKPDLAAANYTDNTISVLQNQLLVNPATQASDIIVSSLSATTATISWTNGDGVKRIVFVKEDNTGSASPVNETDYTANSAFGSGDQIGSSGWYAVYNGTGNTVAITGLSPSVTYQVMVMEYNDNGLAGAAQYQTAAATNNPVNFIPLATLNSLEIAGTSPANTATVNYTAVFGSAISGLSAANFTLSTTGSISGASVASVSGSGTTYTVTVNTGSGDGDITLSLANTTGLSTGLTNSLPVTGGTYTIDKTLPVLDPVTIASNNPDATRAKTGDVIMLSFTASEAIAAPAVTIAGHTVTATITGGDSWSASYTLAASDAEGAVPFSIDFSDLTGNAGTTVASATNSSSITFDKTLPVLTPVTIASDNSDISKAKTGDVIMLSFTASESITAPAVTIAGHTVTAASAGGDSWSASYTLAASDAEGIIPFSIDFSDLAGNAGATVILTTNSSSITFDKTVPALNPVTIASNNIDATRAKPGDVITLSFTASEAIAAPAVTIAGHTVTATSAGGDSWSASYTLTASDAEGIIPFSIDFSDLSGNAGTTVTSTTNSSSVTFDKTALALNPVTITSDNPDATKAKTGDVIMLSFIASEAIAAPAVTIAGHTVTAASAGGDNWSASYTLAASDAEGIIPFSIDFNDLSGNPGVTVTSTTNSSSVTFDKTLPVLTPVTIASDNSDATRAKTGDVITLSFTASESITVPAVTIAGHTVTAASAGGDSWSASYTLAASDAEGAIPFSIDFSDLSGNLGVTITSTTNSNSITFDKTVPALNPVTIASNNIDATRAKPGDIITLSFTASEAIAAPAATIAGHTVTAASAGGDNWSASYTLAASDTEGPIPFSIDFSDLTGNAGTTITSTTNSSSVTFDKTLPVLNPVTIISNNIDATKAKAGDVITLSFTASETIALPAVTIAGQTRVAMNTGGNTWKAAYTVTGSDTEGVVLFSIAFSDQAGNAGVTVTSSTNNSSVTVGHSVPPVIINTPPTLLPVANQTICYTTAQQSIALNGITPGSESGQSVSLGIISSNSSLLSGLSIASGSNGTGMITYTPSDPAGGTTTILVTITDDGGTANGGTDTFTREFTITVNPLPAVSIISDIGANISRGETAVLTASGGTTYTWANAEGIISGQNTAALTVRPAHTTTYTVTASNGAGCSQTASFTVEVAADYRTINATNILTPNGDGVNDTWQIRDIDMYPDNEVKVFDRSGRTVFTRRGYSNNEAWDGMLNGLVLTEDTYYYIIDFGNGEKVTKGYITIIRNR